MYYIVNVTTAGERSDLKAFERKADAISFAEGQTENGAEEADVFEVDGANDARAAKAALEHGENRLYL